MGEDPGEGSGGLGEGCPRGSGYYVQGGLAPPSEPLLLLFVLILTIISIYHTLLLRLMINFKGVSGRPVHCMYIFLPIPLCF